MWYRWGVHTHAHSGAPGAHVARSLSRAWSSGVVFSKIRKMARRSVGTAGGVGCWAYVWQYSGECQVVWAGPPSGSRGPGGARQQQLGHHTNTGGTGLASPALRSLPTLQANDSGPTRTVCPHPQLTLANSCLAIAVQRSGCCRQGAQGDTRVCIAQALQEEECVTAALNDMFPQTQCAGRAAPGARRGGRGRVIMPHAAAAPAPGLRPALNQFPTCRRARRRRTPHSSPP